MPAAKVRADYDELEQIAKIFGQQSDKTRKTPGNLHRRLDVLMDGAWRGRGATQFYREMISSLLPSVKRLGDSLEQASRITRQISKVMKKAEDDAARVLRHEGRDGDAYYSEAAFGSQVVPAIYRPGEPGNEATIVPVYQLEGPWNKGDPVHEVLTLTALKQALDALPPDQRGELLQGVAAGKLPSLSSEKDYNLNTKKIDPSAQQFVRGVIWPDDPKGYLFDNPKTTTNYSSGYKWWKEFDVDEKDDPAALIARSHYGDLQYFHGMATKDNEAPQTTKENMLNWSRFLTDVSTGKIDPDTKVADVPLTKQLFPAHGDITVKELFAYKEATDIEARQRAAGALLHMVQDSYAAGHTDRNPLTDAVTQFHTYGSQDHGLHGAKDQWGDGKTLADRLQSTHGAQAAVDSSARILTMLDQGAPTDKVIEYLDQQVFRLDPAVKPAGPGDQFQANPPKTQKA